MAFRVTFNEVIVLEDALCFKGAVNQSTSKPAIEAAAAHLRSLALEHTDGEFIGSEETLLHRLGFSRSTVRQVARMLEQEGLLRVKRGIGGGYYASRPDARSIERVVSTYLEAIDFEPKDVTVIASALWIEVIRKATMVRGPRTEEMVAHFRKRIGALKPSAPFAAVRSIERESQKAIFALVQSRYVELIFDINAAFASRSFPSHERPEGDEAHLAFVSAWREAKLLELAAIKDGNTELGLMAARYVRSVWHKRIWLLEGS
jgi:DNA-binding transcriptional regulator YhcF (GntR family)